MMFSDFPKFFIIMAQIYKNYSKFSDQFIPNSRTIFNYFDLKFF